MIYDLKARTRDFSLLVIDLVDLLPNSIAARAIANQLVKSGTSVGANYRASSRARSDNEFIAKMNIVLEESDESLFWMELIKEKKWIEDIRIDKALVEANELTSIFVTILKKTKLRINREKSN